MPFGGVFNQPSLRAGIGPIGVANAPKLDQAALQRFMQEARARRMAAMSMMRGSPPQGQMGMGLNGQSSMGNGMSGPVAGKINQVIGS